MEALRTCKEGASWNEEDVGQKGAGLNPGALGRFHHCLAGSETEKDPEMKRTRQDVEMSNLTISCHCHLLCETL